MLVVMFIPVEVSICLNSTTPTLCGAQKPFIIEYFTADKLCCIQKLKISEETIYYFNQKILFVIIIKLKLFLIKNKSYLFLLL